MFNLTWSFHQQIDPNANSLSIFLTVVAIEDEPIIIRHIKVFELIMLIKSDRPAVRTKTKMGKILKFFFSINQNKKIPNPFDTGKTFISTYALYFLIYTKRVSINTHFISQWNVTVIKFPSRSFLFFVYSHISFFVFFFQISI